jgi:hypothetical protein
LKWKENRIFKLKAVITSQKKDMHTSIEIYNLSDDPYEENDLSLSMPEVVNEFLDMAKSARFESSLYPLIKQE